MVNIVKDTQFYTRVRNQSLNIRSLMNSNIIHDKVIVLHPLSIKCIHNASYELQKKKVHFVC
jgi:hypothetical protein